MQIMRYIFKKISGFGMAFYFFVFMGVVQDIDLTKSHFINNLIRDEWKQIIKKMAAFFSNNFTINNSYHIQNLYTCILTKLFLSSSKWQLDWNHEHWNFIIMIVEEKCLKIYSLMIAPILFIEIPVFNTNAWQIIVVSCYINV